MAVLALRAPGDLSAAGPGAWAAFGYLSLVSMFLGFFAWYRGLAIGPMAQVSQVQLVQPVLSLVWAALLLGEPLGARRRAAGASPSSPAPRPPSAPGSARSERAAVRASDHAGAVAGQVSEPRAASGRDSGRRRGAARRLLTRTLTSAWTDDIFSEAASAAFWQTLSLPPLLLGLFATLGLRRRDLRPGDRRRRSSSGCWSWPAGCSAARRSTTSSRRPCRTCCGAAPAGVISVGFLISLWSGSSAMSAFIDAITRAHDQYELRNLVWQRILAILLYVVGLITGHHRHPADDPRSRAAHPAAARLVGGGQHPARRAAVLPGHRRCRCCWRSPRSTRSPCR